MLKFLHLGELKKNKYAELIIAFLLFFPYYSYYIQTILGGYFGYEGKIVPGILYGLGAICGVISYFRMSNKLLGGVLTLLFLIGTFMFQMLYPRSYEVIHTSYTDIAYSPDVLLFLYSLPLVFWNLKRLNYDLLIRICLIISRGCIILFLCTYWAYLSLKFMELEYMTFSYNALPAICFCIVSTPNKKYRIIDRVMAVAAIVTVFVSGSRGCSVCVLFFIVTYFIIIKKVSKGVVILCFSAFVLFLMTDVMSLLMSFSFNLESQGIYSRTITRILDDSFAISNDRDILKEIVGRAIIDSPVIGYGVWGDRAILNGFVHNIAYEILCSYGVFIGGFVLLWIFGKTAISLFSNISISRKILLCTTIPYGLIQLFFSGSYLNNAWFFFLVAQLASISINFPFRHEAFGTVKQ